MESKTVLKNYAKFTERRYFVERTILEGLSPKLIILKTEFFLSRVQTRIFCPLAESRPGIVIWILEGVVYRKRHLRFLTRIQEFPMLQSLMQIVKTSFIKMLQPFLK